MKNNSIFSKYLVLEKQYFKSKIKSIRENIKKELETEVESLVGSGWITPSMKVLYDLDKEKYTTMGLKGLSISVYDKDKSIQAILRQTYSFLPKGIMNKIPAKKLIFHPHKELSYKEDGIFYANTFIKNKFLSFVPSQDKKIKFIEWNNFPTIKALFENVFKDEIRMNYFVNWLAYGLQTRSKTRTSIISKGMQGTGKGVIYTYIVQYAIGERYTTLLENEALKSRFNGELENKLFVLANEIKADFREGNSTYERLKMYVSDNEIRFEEKNTKARTIPNFFNIWFHSNNEVPLQIQGNDRRYSVFNTKSKKLDEVSEEIGLGATQYFIEEVKKERDKFIFDIMSLEYCMSSATKPMETEEKDLIYEQSMTKLEVLADKIKTKDIEYFKDIIEDFYKSSEFNLLKEDIYILQIKTPLEFVSEIQKQFNGNYIKNDIFKIIYKIFVTNKEESDKKMWLNINTHFGKAIYKKINNKAFKYRKINKDKESVFREDVFPNIIPDARESLIYQIQSIQELINNKSRHALFDMDEQKEKLITLQKKLEHLELPKLDLTSDNLVQL